MCMQELSLLCECNYKMIDTYFVSSNHLKALYSNTNMEGFLSMFLIQFVNVDVNKHGY